MAKYCEKFFEGGLVGFEGVHVNIKPIKTIKAVFSASDTHLSLTAEYADNEDVPTKENNKEHLEFDVDDIDGGINIKNVKHYWNEILLQGDDE